MTKNEIKKLLKQMNEDEKTTLLSLLSGVIWSPLPGPQAVAFASQADIIGYGGAAGGGKTDLACGMALLKHRKSLILRREGTQLTGVIERLENILGSRDGLNMSRGIIWRRQVRGKKRFIQMGGLSDPDDHKKYQGQDHDLKIIDEATECRESDVRFIMGWMRSADPTIKSQVLMTFNPPTTAEGRWVIDFFGPWLRPDHPNPAKPGEIRYFTTDPKTGQDVACDGPDLVYLENDQGEAEACVPLARTFISAKVEDNPYYMDTGYKAALQALPEPLRSQMLRGDFTAGVEDHEWQIIPTAWLDAAMNRWTEKQGPIEKGPMTSMGVDVARGGKDKTVIVCRHDRWFDRPIELPGSQTPDGHTVAGQVVQHRRDLAPVHLDKVGWGAAPLDILTGNGIQVIGVNGAEGTKERSYPKPGMGAGMEATDIGSGNRLPFVNLRSLLIWRMREALDPDAERPIALPPDPQLRADLTAARWELKNGAIAAESKDRIKERLGRSPDKGDAFCYALMDTVKTDMRRAPQRKAKSTYTRRY